jgi:pimeloyl-ACP methyl ester carboxylesterase
MKRQSVNGFDMAYIDVGAGSAIVCIHGALFDFREWNAQLGPLSRAHRVIAVSLRHFFPERWEGTGNTFKVAQHVADVIAFVEALDVGKVHLMGHSRGGHIAFRVAQLRPDLIENLILAEPGGVLDSSFVLSGRPATRSGRIGPSAAEKIAAGDVDGGLQIAIDGIEGLGAWQAVAPGLQQEMRDNANTVIGQVGEQRQAFTRADAESISVRTLFIVGANTQSDHPVIARALAAHVPNARTITLPNATHFMLVQNPVGYSSAVLEFLAAA